MPTLLCFDTSTERMAVALQGPHGRWLANVAGGAAASAGLLPQVARLLAEAGLVHRDLDAIAFGRGPGAFTGLRTACAVAQGLAFGLGRPVLAIDSLLIVAEDARLQTGVGEGEAFDIGVAMDARMDEVYAAVYRWQGGAWSERQAPGLLALPAFRAAWAGLDLQAVAGSAWAAFGERLTPPARCLPTEQDRAAALLRLALRAHAAGHGVDAAEALPLYLRDKVAQTTQERAAAKAAGSA
jgi:tRNA threonylcarbamoyladenosine biosynthesis protein TsaB